MSERLIALEAYETLAESYAAVVDTKPHNAHYERPATLSLLPDVTGLDVLDAGCGPGVYSQLLLKNGATVTALDASPKMVELARARVGDRAAVHLADLSERLELSDDAFDLVLAPLVLDYIENWRSVFREFARVLRPGGTLVFSIHHPFFDYVYFRSKNYFLTERVGSEWRGFPGVKVYMPSIRRPMEEVFNPLIEAGFRLDRTLEPKVTEELKASDPRHYEELSREPAFLCIRAVKN